MRAQFATPFAFPSPCLAWIETARAMLLGAVFTLVSGKADDGTAAGAGARVDAAAAENFRRLILPHLDAAYSLARYLTRDATASEDIVQDAYLKAFRNFAGFRGGDSRAWILAIVRNATRDWQARRRVENRYIATPIVTNDDDTLPQDAIEAIASEIETVESTLVRDGEDRRVRAVIELIPDRLREVLVLREMDDLSYREIADVTQLPIGTVMSRLARAREAFAKIWQRLESGRAAQ